MEVVEMTIVYKWVDGHTDGQTARRTGQGSILINWAISLAGLVCVKIHLSITQVY